MSIELITLLLFAGTFALLATGLPIALSLGTMAVIFCLAFWGWGRLSILGLGAFTNLQNVDLVAAPLFIFMGWIIYKSRVAEDLFDAIYAWMGKLRGGLAMGTTIISAIFGAICGDIVAAIFTINTVALPPLLRRGYNKRLVIGTILSGAMLSFLIPPSIVLIIYCSVTQISIGRMYLGCFIPGLLLASLYISYIWTRCRLQPEMAPSTPTDEDMLNLREKVVKLKGISWPLVLLFAMLGGIYSGIVTPMEASAVGAFGALLIALGKRRLSWNDLWDTLKSTGQLTSILGWMILAASMFTIVYVGIGAADLARSIVTLVPGGGLGVIIAMQVLLIIVGMFMDVTAMILIFGPIYQGIIQALGFDPVWFGVLFMVNIQTALMSPPYGAGLFFTKAAIESVPDKPSIKMGDIIMGSLPFVVMQIVCLALLLFFPDMATFLPDLLIK